MSGHKWLKGSHEVCTALNYHIWLLSCPGRARICLTDLFFPDASDNSLVIFLKKCQTVISDDEEDYKEQV